MTAGQQSGPGAARPAEWEALKGDVNDAGRAAVAQGLGFVDAAKAQAVDYAVQRKGDAAQSVADLANSLRDSGRTLDDRPNLRAVFDSAAEGLDGLASSIRERSFADLYADLEAVARRRPAAFVAASAVAGFLVARFVRASSDTLPGGAPARTPATAPAMAPATTAAGALPAGVHPVRTGA